jgi:threonine dehydrogenase-like Zn-dependent dehydrogenase
MRQALLFGPADLRVVEVATPTPAAGQVTVRVLRSSPYGTDVEFYRGADLRHQPPYPVGLGADFAGVVEAVGPGVEGYAPGDRVVAMALYHCGDCRFCRSGQPNLCLRNVGGNDSRQECFQDVAIVWANKLARLPDGVSFDDGALLCGPMMGLNIFEKLRPKPGETTVVIGAGAMGLAQVPLAKHFGARTILIGQGAACLRIAGELGADVILDDRALGEGVAAAARQAAPDGIDCVVETTTSGWGIRLSLDLAGMGGRIAWIGGPPVSIDPWALVGKEITICGIRAGHHQQAALDLIANGRIDLKPAITHRVSLEELPAMFALLAGPDRGTVGRVIVEHDR